MANEKRLIDADKIYDAVERRYQVSSGIEHRCERDLLDLICAADIVDAVEVVRCQDCKFYELKCYPDGKKRMCCENNNAIWTATKPDDFCSYGERKDGDGNG